jgi:metallophosphoesterase (TIGR00282 family)
VTDLERDEFNVLIIGDIVGEPGRKALFISLSQLIQDEKVDFVVANAENAAGGFGITGNIAGKLYSYGVDCITTGNHVWRNREVFKVIDTDSRLLRPMNYPHGTPGRGWTVVEKGGIKLAVLNLMGRVYMEPLECPFRTARREIALIKKETKHIVVDFHGEATSEKIAMGWWLDGQVSAVVGTHTHVQTADERVLPGGTAYITDAGMTGPFDSIIGVRKERALQKFTTLIPSKFITAEDDIRINAVVVTIETNTGNARLIKRIHHQILE